MDIVERLRNNVGGESYTWKTITEAADEIERLRDEVDHLHKMTIEWSKLHMEDVKEIERLREEHETVSRIVDGMTLQFVERGKEIERLRRDVEEANARAYVMAKEVTLWQSRAALKEGE